MSVSIILLSLLWTVAVLLLVLSIVRKSKALGFWGDVMLALSFGVSSGMLLAERSYWIGAAFAFPAVRQVYVLIVPRLQAQRTP